MSNISVFQVEMRFSEILEGSRADVTLRIYGKELPVLMELLEKSIDILEEIPGAEEVEIDALTALRKSPVLSARPNYTAIARYGMNFQQVNSLLQSAMGGKALQADAVETLVCTYLSVTLLLGLGLNALWGWWWADPVSGLILVGFILKEGWKAVEEAREREE